MSTTTTPDSPRTPHRVVALIVALCVALPLFLAACEIIEVLQPSQANRGQEISVVATIENPFDDANPHKGVVSVLVPVDWTFVSGQYDGDAGSGTMLESPAWADSTEIVLPAPAGMKWIGSISSQAATVTNAPETYDVTLRLRVGQTVGNFGLGYFTTTDAFATQDIVFGSSDENTADTLMNQPIEVLPTTSNEDGAGDRAFVLQANQPNPFRTSTAIRYTLNRPAAVRVTVFDTRGRQVTVVDQGAQSVGEHRVDLAATSLSAGTYLYQLEVDGTVVQTRRMTLSR